MDLKVLCLLFAFVAVGNAVKVPVTVYYESLCPDSAKFINEQLSPAAATELINYMDVTFVPFGKSQFATQGSEVLFTCHHGPNECYGNKVHACAIEHIQANSYQTEYTRESLTMDFINCMMKVGKNFDDNVYPGARCARDNHINTWENIQHCANSTEGSQLLKKHGEATNAFQMPLASVPTVVIKYQHDTNVNDHALTDFQHTLCSYIPQPKPKICSEINAAGHNAAASLLLMSTIVFALIKFF